MTDEKKILTRDEEADEIIDRLKHPPYGLFGNWTAAKEALLEGLSKNHCPITNVILENQREYLKK